MSIFDILGEWVQPYLDLLPMVSRRPASNEWMVVDGLLGVRESRWARVHIPAITHIEYFPRHEIPIDIGVQKLEVRGNKAVIVNCTARVCVIDPVVVRDSVGTEEWQEAAAQMVRGQVAQCVGAGAAVQMNQEVENELLHLGLELTFFQVEDYQHTRSITITQ